MKIEELNNLILKNNTQFNTYFNFLLDFNSHTNLTAITDKQQVFVKHFLDSILPIEQIVKNAKIVDVGTGAGFPGLPIKIVRPDVNLTLVDSLNKRIKFLDELTTKLNLPTNLNTNPNLTQQAQQDTQQQLKKQTQQTQNLKQQSIQQTQQQILNSVQKQQTQNLTQIFHARAEDFCLNNRAKFDVAVAKLNTLLEYLLPLVKVGGIVLAYKGANFKEELALAQNALNILGGKVQTILTFNLPTTDEDVSAGERNIIVIKKVKPTPKQFPRGQNKPKTNPI